MRDGHPMGVVRVLPKGQITMPKAVRERLGIEVGDDLLVEAVSEREARIIVLPRPTSLKDLRGLVKPRHPLDEETVRQAIREGRRGLAERWGASRRSAGLVAYAKALREAAASVNQPLK
ncbi:AbrB/MazE/SpoVT family DNA-binding domain-containing protein [Carboxydochorda subterranea]|uniref:AbrB/MazE/SpoVT family DNA-binding domain-containing protein n=1 Tax=Carboxydichorda subterranea TaxID=3109565 RepID=A0ABZ1C201_9FIRM|nr:AbrB/MazE/SpoVT family DNA-binding domain-containing protein [Limnochorda sp. L945t]WRP18875.1 AbrB/MazE/SpoVT family DNA-binding domain-containing protein [Limnochorda sp. L945t]